MARQPAPQKARTNWTAVGGQMMGRQDFQGAVRAFTNAVADDKNSSVHRYHLGLAHQAAGEPGPAATNFAEALRLNPRMIEAARGLGQIAAARAFPANVQLHRGGLRSALEFDTLNRDQIAEAAVYLLARSDPLKASIADGHARGFLEAARAITLKSTGDLLKDELLQKAIADNVIRMPDLEALLTAIRRVALLELPAERFQDRVLVTFLLTLGRQCWINEYIWSVSDEEQSALDALLIDMERVLAGDVAEGLKIMLASLYRPVSATTGPASPEALKAMRPNGVRDAICQLATEHDDRVQRAARLKRLGPITDPTSQAVAAMYESNPFPRWTSLGVLLSSDEWRAMLASQFGESRIAFMNQPFDVLIAGCGTGVQAVAASFVYGPNARITALDLSASSLAYAERMAGKFGAKNLTFVQGDILDLKTNAEFAKRFKVIECTGVLHHMADPLQGWRSINACLADDGLMLIALYSDIARKRWTAFRNDPLYPGEHCTDADLRSYRMSLFARPETEVGSEFKGLRDLYTTSGFRDLILHVSEKRFTLPEIGRFLSDEGLVFKGFMNRQMFDLLKRRSPTETWPGSINGWAALEEAMPVLFQGMYYFWCERG